MRSVEYHPCVWICTAVVQILFVSWEIDMRLVSIPKDRLKLYAKDPEMLQKSERPCALVLHLKYKGRRYDFAIPLRSNIAPSTPKELYYPLPPRNKTKEKHRHGLHYVKMFPIKRSIMCKFYTENNIYMSIVKSILDRDEKLIIAQCQKYLDDYTSGNRPLYATDLDYLVTLVDK